MDQSLQAPHAVQNKTQVCVRTSDTTQRIDLADIDRIEALLRRRTESDRLANSMLLTHFDRIRNFIPASNQEPWAWWRVIPAYVGQPICQPEQCRDQVFRTLHGAPNGAFAFHSDDSPKPSEYVAINAQGDIFRAKKLRTITIGTGSGINLGTLCYEAMRTFEKAQAFLRKDEVAYAGMICISTGLQNVRSVFMKWGDIHVGSVAFPDESMTAQLISSYEEFDESDFSTSQSPVTIPDLAYRLVSHVGHAFSIGQIPKQFGF